MCPLPTVMVPCCDGPLPTVMVSCPLWCVPCPLWWVPCLPWWSLAHHANRVHLDSPLPTYSTFLNFLLSPSFALAYSAQVISLQIFPSQTHFHRHMSVWVPSPQRDCPWCPQIKAIPQLLSELCPVLMFLSLPTRLYPLSREQPRSSFRINSMLLPEPETVVWLTEVITPLLESV